SFLFGSILTVTRHDVLVVAVLGAAGLAAVLLLYRALAGIVLDEEAAVVSGVPVTALNLVIVVLAALTVAVSMRIGGILVISAWMVLPVMAAGRGAVCCGTRSELSVARLVGLGSVLGGLTVAYYADMPPGGTIVLLAAGAFLLASGGGAVRSR